MNRRQYVLELGERIEIHYDRQTDTLYIYLDPDKQPDEEVLGETGDIVFGFKNGELVVIQLIGLRKRIEEL